MSFTDIEPNVLRRLKVPGGGLDSGPLHGSGRHDDR